MFLPFLLSMVLSFLAPYFFPLPQKWFLKHEERSVGDYSCLRLVLVYLIKLNSCPALKHHHSKAVGVSGVGVVYNGLRSLQSPFELQDRQLPQCKMRKNPPLKLCWPQKRNTLWGWTWGTGCRTNDLTTFSSGFCVWF